MEGKYLRNCFEVSLLDGENICIDAIGEDYEENFIRSFQQTLLWEREGERK